PVFKSMFSGDWAEKGKEEVEIKDVVFEEFVNLAELIFSMGAHITDSTLPHILALAFRFQMEQVVAQCEIHLIFFSTSFSTAKKLHMSDQYRLEMLEVATIITYSSAHEICTLESTPEYAKLSADMKAAILDRVFF
ncbi:hypothetical protein PMAYCL1PPCAC_20330, partial [Pristionchus mayeri]